MKRRHQFSMEPETPAQLSLADRSDIGGLVLSSLIEGPQRYAHLIHEVMAMYADSHHGESVSLKSIVEVINEIAGLGEVYYRKNSIESGANEILSLTIGASKKTLDHYTKIGGTD